RSAERLLERLRVGAEDCSSARERAALEEAIGRLDSRAREVQRSFRLALLQYRANTAATARRERELLLSGAATPAELRARKAQQGQTALSAAADVTTALQETVSMMNREIEKSASNISTMQASSDALRRTKAQYMTMDDLLHMSKRLVRALEQADAMDRWLMLGGLLIFSLVTLNILRKRLWIPGLYTLLSVLRYVFTLGSSRAAAPAIELVSAGSGLLTQLAATATVALQDTPAASAMATPVLIPTAVAATPPRPSTAAVDTLGTTVYSSGTGVAAVVSDSENDVHTPLQVRAEDAGDDEICNAEEALSPLTQDKRSPRPGVGARLPRKHHFTLPVQRPKTTDR
ncbi:Vesicle transport protein S20, partial [Coemansia nantahalensis]